MQIYCNIAFFEKQVECGENLKIKNYYQKLNKKSQEIFNDSIDNVSLLSKVHGVVADFHKISTFVADPVDAKMFQLVCAQIEASCLALTFGLYRPALSTLRLSFEFGMGGIYFSTNKLAQKEWENGNKEADIKWSIINSPENGVLSKRFADAFFPGLSEYSGDYQERARSSYRCLSEYVHGNNDTWKLSGLNLAKNQGLIDIYEKQVMEIEEILKFAFCCRYLLGMKKEQRDDMQSIFNEKLTHIELIRIAFGGPKDIK